MSYQKNDMEEKKELNVNYITFGKYKDKDLTDLLRDRKYCSWLLEQDWFLDSYEYLFNAIKNYDPKIYFFPTKVEDETTSFKNYKYFNLTNVDDLKIKLTEKELFCYKFYLKMIDELLNKIEVNITAKKENPYDIKAPSKWLKILEDEGKELGVTRDDFKEFLNCYELQNLTYIIEDIKKMGNLEYNGANSFKIAKKRSLEQENYWKDILKEKYGDQIACQFKYEISTGTVVTEEKEKKKVKKDKDNCFFDFIRIEKNTIYECKLGLKDFNEEQFNKYISVLDNKYNIIFLISTDCVINLDLETIYTTNLEKYILYQVNIPLMNNPSKFDEMIFDYDIYGVEDLRSIL